MATREKRSAKRRPSPVGRILISDSEEEVELVCVGFKAGPKRQRKTPAAEVEAIVINEDSESSQDANVSQPPKRVLKEKPQPSTVPDISFEESREKKRRRNAAPSTPSTAPVETKSKPQKRTLGATASKKKSPKRTKKVCREAPETTEFTLQVATPTRPDTSFSISMLADTPVPPNNREKDTDSPDIYEIIGEKFSTRGSVVKTLIKMFDDGCTLPFICRYRRDESGSLSPELIQSIRSEYTNLLQVRKKAKALVERLRKENKLTPALEASILASQTSEELQVLAEPFKSDAPRTYAAKARKAGLEGCALQFWRGEKTISQLAPQNLISSKIDGRKTCEEVVQSMKYIISDELRRSRDILNLMSEMSRTKVQMTVSEKKGKKKAEVGENRDKFQDYFHFNRPVTAIESHQVLAINRGEHLGVLSVKVELAGIHERGFIDLLRSKLIKWPRLDNITGDFIEETAKDCYERLCKPHLSRISRDFLKSKAEKEALEVFSMNLRSLLMTPPVRGEPILGIDPGFTNGCKMAMVSKSGELLEHRIMYLRKNPESVLIDMIKKYKCNLVAVGDGKGTQEVKVLLSNCIKRKMFSPQNVRFSTVREAGVSVYSVSPQADDDLPGLDSFVKGSVAIARRLQDPLVEFIKVEPKHLGIGMYQHDMNESMLKEALQGTIVECVSYVGVDVNVCPEFLLRQVAGLNATAAKNLIEYRKKHGPFHNREQLQLVPQIGPRRYEQCAGFIKILPETVKQCQNECVVTKIRPTNKKSISFEFEPLDTTIIHPESYSLAKSILKEAQLDVKQLGTAAFIQKATEAFRVKDVEYFAKKFNSSNLTIELIFKALQTSHDSDLRDEGCAPIFSDGVGSIKDLRIHSIVTGKVMNVVSFGAFVDISVERGALLHSKQLMGVPIKVNDIIECRILTVDVQKQRVSLGFVKFL